MFLVFVNERTRRTSDRCNTLLLCDLGQRRSLWLGIGRPRTKLTATIQSSTTYNHHFRVPLSRSNPRNRPNMPSRNNTRGRFPRLIRTISTFKTHSKNKSFAHSLTNFLSRLHNTSIPIRRFIRRRPSSHSGITSRHGAHHRRTRQRPVGNVPRLHNTLSRYQILPILLDRNRRTVARHNSQTRRRMPRGRHGRTLVNLPRRIHLRPFRRLLTVLNTSVRITFNRIHHNLRIFTAPNVTGQPRLTRRVTTARAMGRRRRVRQRHRRAMNRQLRRSRRRARRHRQRRCRGSRRRPQVILRAETNFRFIRFTRPTTVALRAVTRNQRFLSPSHRRRRRGARYYSSFTETTQ